MDARTLVGAGDGAGDGDGDDDLRPWEALAGARSSLLHRARQASASISWSSSPPPPLAAPDPAFVERAARLSSFNHSRFASCCSGLSPTFSLPSDLGTSSFPRSSPHQLSAQYKLSRSVPSSPTFRKSAPNSPAGTRAPTFGDRFHDDPLQYAAHAGSTHDLAQDPRFIGSTAAARDASCSSSLIESTSTGFDPKLRCTSTNNLDISLQSQEESSCLERQSSGKVGKKRQIRSKNKSKAANGGAPSSAADSKDAELREAHAKRCKQEEDSQAEPEQHTKTEAEQSNSGDPEEAGLASSVKESDVKPPDPPKPDYIHVRARRGQATDSHSLAERVRREKISERMKYLQDLVPGCTKVSGKALMLDEIINYVQSLQRQVEFLSMKLVAVNPRVDMNVENFLHTSSEMIHRVHAVAATRHENGTMLFSADPNSLADLRNLHGCPPVGHPTGAVSLHQQSAPEAVGLERFHGGAGAGAQSVLLSSRSATIGPAMVVDATSVSYGDQELDALPSQQQHQTWEDELQSIVHMGFRPQNGNSSVPFPLDLPGSFSDPATCSNHNNTER